jgi:hypothetical protein
MLLPPHSLHRRFSLPCGQKALPPHSLHWGFCLPCGQMLLPPHSLHWDLFLPWMQMLLPPHSLHWCFSLPCLQMPLPLHSLQRDFSLPCAQMPLPPHALHLLGCFPCGHFPFCPRGSGTILTSVDDAGVAPTDRHARLRQQWHRTTNNQTCCAMHKRSIGRCTPRELCSSASCQLRILWTIVHFEVTGLRADVLCALRGVRRHVHTR